MKNHKINAMTLIFAVLLAGSLNAQVHVIEQQNLSFSPQSIIVNVGDTVRWLWTSGSHTTTSVSIPSGAASWDSPLSQSNTSFDYVVAHAGTYNYHCTPHSGMGMIGSFEAFPATGIKRSVTKNDVKIFPNPAKDYFAIAISYNIKNCEIFVSDIIGNIQKRQLCTEHTDTRINLDNIPDGLYLVKVYDGDVLVSEQKLIVVN